MVVDISKINRVKKLLLVGHRYEINRVLPFNDLYEKHSNHHRLTVFVHKGLKCSVPDCKCEASLLIEGVDKLGYKHIDLYTKDFMLMTIDHTHPVCKGGKDKLENLEPMCEYHNSLKGGNII